MPAYTVSCNHCGEFEIEKPMHAPLPKCACGRTLRRVWAAAPVVTFNAPGFYATDVAHFEKLVGQEKAERVRRLNEDATRRARQGRLTDYERALEGV